MRLVWTPHFLRAYNKAPQKIQQAFDKQARLLLANLNHPSLPAKKYDESRHLWQARITPAWRIYLMIEGGACVLHEIKVHPK
jgi:hypothetical protein